MDTVIRLLRLVEMLPVRDRWRGTELADALSVTTRTIREDVRRLRELDFDIDSTPGASGGYSIRRGGAMPPVRFDDGEALAVAIGLRLVSAMGSLGDADRALTKLDRVLPDRLRRTVSRVHETTTIGSAPGHQVSLFVLDEISRAIEASEVLRFDYRSGRAESVRRVEPHRLVQVSGRWYLIAFDLDVTAWRTFRLDRLAPKVPTGPGFTPRPLPDHDPLETVARGRRQAMFAYRAEVTVEAGAKETSKRIPTGMWSAEAIDDSTCVLHAGAQTPQLLAAYLAAMDLDFRVDSATYPDLGREVGVIAERFNRSTS